MFRSSRSRATVVVAISVALSIAALALVVSQTPHAVIAPSSRPDWSRFPEETRRKVEAHLASVPSSVEWRTVSEVETAIGRFVRLRPFVHGVEARGCDVMLGPAGLRSAAPVSSIDWSAAERLARDAFADPFHLRAVEWSANGPASIFWIAFAGPTRDPEGRLTLRWPGESQDAAAGRSTHRGAARLLAMPWSGDPPDLSHPTELELRLSDDGSRVIEARESRSTDGDARAYIFDPNPVVTSGRRSFSEADPVDGYRRWRRLAGLDGSGRLRGERVRVESDRPPIADEASGIFGYPSYDPRFEECMAYYHADHAIARAESLGVGLRGRAPLTVRVHASALDVSWYGQAERAVFLGDGGVDDAEDADIILHEVAHALHDAIVPGFGDGDTRALSEGFADYWAASLTGDPRVAEWDATGYDADWLRRVDTDARYPESLTGRSHADGQIWSGLLWELRGSLGREQADRLALHAFLEQETDTTFPQAGEALIRAAAALGFSATDLSTVRDTVGRRGLGPWEAVVLLSEGQEREIVLPGATSVLGRAIHSLRLSADGGCAFLHAGAGGPELVASPLVWRSDLEPALPTSRPELSVTVRRIADRGEVEFSFDAGAARAIASWSAADPALTWTYFALPSDGLWPLAAVASIEGLPLPPTSTPLASVGATATTVVSSLTALLPEPACEMTGAQFALRATAEGLALQRTAVPLGCGSVARLSAHPNPAMGAVTLRLTGVTGGRATVEVHDVLGRRVRTLDSAHAAPQIAWWSWDGLDDRGRAVAPGIYFASASAGAGANRVDARARIVRLR